MKRRPTNPQKQDEASDDWKDPGKVNRSRFPRLANRYFFTLPTAFLRLLDKHQRIASRIDLPAEMELAEAAGDSSIGFRDGEVLRDGWLFSRWGTAEHRKVVKAQPMPTEVSDQIVRLIAPADRSALAYLGWLFTNRTFLQELDQLVRDNSFLCNPKAARPEVSEYRQIPREFPPMQPIRDYDERILPSGDPTQDFERRWRLQALTSPMSAAPMLIDLRSNYTFAFLWPRCICVFTIPDIAAVPGRDELRNVIEEVLHQSRMQSPHLREWFDVVSRDTLGKRDRDRFGRIYQLQHIMRVLHSRHHSQLHRCTERVNETLAKLFKVGPRTISDDIKVVSERLGPEWLAGGGK